jgi:hypothetical protein
MGVKSFVDTVADERAQIALLSRATSTEYR